MTNTCVELANKILALRDDLPKTKDAIEKKYRAAVLSLCRDITEGPLDAPFGQITPKQSITDD